MSDNLLDSGSARVFSSGAQRDCNKGKGRCDLLPPTALLTLSKHYQKGAEKYGENNWRKGMPLSTFIDSGLRHLLKANAGHIDEDHLAAAAWNILCAIEMRDAAPQTAQADPPPSWIDIWVNGNVREISAKDGVRVLTYAEICRYGGLNPADKPMVTYWFISGQSATTWAPNDPPLAVKHHTQFTVTPCP